MAKVYTLYWKQDDHEITADLRPLEGNGDFKKVYPIGFEFDPNSNDPTDPGNMLRQPDLTYVQKTSAYQGLPVHVEHLPDKLRYKGRMREFTDVMGARNWFVVAHAFRDVVERVEPGIHQFQPVEIVDEDGAHLADYYWFNPCNRIDSMDREHTTHEFYRDRRWKFTHGKKYVASLERIGDHHFWIDPRTPGAYNYLKTSQKMRDALIDAGLTGLGFYETEAV